MRMKQEIFLLEACVDENPSAYVSFIRASRAPLSSEFSPHLLSSVLRARAFQFFLSVVLRKWNKKYLFLVLGD
jgi:hypothetical protein